MPEGRRKTNFEPAMIFSLDHLKKDDLKFDIDAEIARFKVKKGPENEPLPPEQKSMRPGNTRADTKFP